MASGREFSRITAVRNTRYTDTCNTTSGSAVVTNIGSTTGWAAGDVLKITGAGGSGATLYETIATVDSATQVTLSGNCFTTTTGTAIENPKQITVNETYTSVSNRTWAIGGKRSTIDETHSRTLFAATNGAVGGWTATLENTGTIYTQTSQVTVGAAGDRTNGPFLIRGDTGRVEVKSNNPASTFSLFQLDGAFLKIQNLHFHKATTGGFLAAIINISTTDDSIFENCTFQWSGSGSTGAFAYCVSAAANRGQRHHFINCDFIGAEVGFYRNSGGGASFFCAMYNCYFSGNVYGMQVQSGCYALYDCIFAAQTGDAIRYNSITDTVSLFAVNLTIHGATSDGIEISNGNTVGPTTIINTNLTGNGGYGITYTDTEKFLYHIDYNNFGNGSTANTSGAVNGLTQGPNDLAVDPQYTDASSKNFAVGTNLKEKAMPLGGTKVVGGSNSATYSYKAIGAAQRQEAGGGGGGPLIGGRLVR